MSTSTTSSIPVTQAVIDKGDTAIVLDLVGLTTPEKISVSWPPPALPSNPTLKLESTIISAAAALEAGYPGLISFHGNAAATYILADVSAFIERPGMAGTIIKKERWGVSYRFVVKAWNLKTKTDISLKSIAADCTINGSSSAFEVDVIGIPANRLLASVPALSMTFGSFDMDKYEELGMVQKQLNNYIAQRGELKPQLLGVEVDWSQMPDLYTRSPSTQLGMSGVQVGNTETTTWSRRPDDSDLPQGLTTDEGVVDQMYIALDVTGTPSSTQRTTAKKSNFRGES